MDVSPASLAAVKANGDRTDSSTIKVFGPSGPLPGIEVSVSVRDNSRSATEFVPRPCGSGCVAQAFSMSPGVSQVRVSVTAPEWTGEHFFAELAWLLGDRDPKRVVEVIETMRAVPELSMTETVDSGPGLTVSPGTFTVSVDLLVDAERYAGVNVEEVVVATRRTGPSTASSTRITDIRKTRVRRTGSPAGCSVGRAWAFP